MDYEWKVYDFDHGFKHGTKAKVDILIGCPIQKREWIIDKWFWHVMAACKIAGLRPGFIFVLDTQEEPLNTMIMNQAKLHNATLILCDIPEEPREDKRTWNSIRYHRMAYLRNLLLEGVRDFGPDFFLSLDSDILLHEQTIKSLVENIGDYDAIGGKAYMTHTGTNFPSFGLINNLNKMIRRYDVDGVIKVDVIMAIKLMKPSAYSISYSYDPQGEDIGFSRNCVEAGLKLAWDGTYGNKHVMRKQDLESFDSRVGF